MNALRRLSIHIAKAQCPGPISANEEGERNATSRGGISANSLAKSPTPADTSCDDEQCQRKPEDGVAELLQPRNLVFPQG